MEGIRSGERKTVRSFVRSSCFNQFPQKQQSQSSPLFKILLLLQLQLFFSLLLFLQSYNYVEEYKYYYYQSCCFNSLLLSLLFIIVIPQISPNSTSQQAISSCSWITSISRERLLFLDRERNCFLSRFLQISANSRFLSLSLSLPLSLFFLSYPIFFLLSWGFLLFFVKKPNL